MVNVDTVYQTVQALANKEQRGYLTPQEFNLFAIQAQNDIFEQYFYDLDAIRAENPQKRELGDSVRHILFKIGNTNGVTIDPNTTVLNGTIIPPNRFTGKIFVTIGGRKRTVTKVENQDQIYDLLNSKWHQKGFDDIVYFEDGTQNIGALGDQIQVWSGGGQITTDVTCETITGSPGLVYWGYVIINEKPVYSPGNSKPFDLHKSEQPDLVAKILKLAGISMEDQELYQAGGTEDALNQQQQNK